MLTCIVVALPVTAQSLPPELAEFRQRVLAHTQQQSATVSLREAQPANVANPDNPVDFVGIAHNQILAEGLQGNRLANARAASGPEAIGHWQKTARRYLEDVVPQDRLAAVEVMVTDPCPQDFLHPWRTCLPWPTGPGPTDPFGPIVVWRDTSAKAGAGEFETARIQAMAEDLYGNVHREQVAFATAILEELYALTASDSLASFVSSVKRLERRILDTNLMSLEEKIPLLVVTSTARHSFAFRTSAIHFRGKSSDDESSTNSSDVVRADLSGAADGASVGFILGGPWGAAFGGVLLGAIHSGLEYESQQSIFNGGVGDGGTTGGNDFGGDGTWTPWLNRDSPGGSGDYETLRDFVAAGQVCANPTAIQCETLDGRSWQDLGRPYTCDTQTGGVCRKANQADGRCPDFRVRFRCD